MQVQEFKPNYMGVPIKATVSPERVTIKMGLRKLDAPLANLRHLYVIDHGSPAGHELMLSHEPAPGKNKVFRLTTTHADPELLRLIETLVALRPEIDIRNVASKAAYRMMGATNVVAVIGWLMPVLITLIFVVIMAPWLFHGIDGGHDEIDAATFDSADFDLDSRNVTISNGQFLFEQALTIETTSDSGTSVEWAIPIVGLDWKSGDPVHLVLKTHELSAEEAEHLNLSSGIDGVVRNIWWEGLADDENAYFGNSFGLQMADDVQEVEYAADTKMELYLALFVIGFIAVLMTIIGVVVARKQRARQT